MNNSIIQVQAGVGSERILTVRQNSPFANDLSTRIQVQSLGNAWCLLLAFFGLEP